MVPHLFSNLNFGTSVDNLTTNYITPFINRPSGYLYLFFSSHASSAWGSGSNYIVHCPCAPLPLSAIYQACARSSTLGTKFPRVQMPNLYEGHRTWGGRDAIFLTGNDQEELLFASLENVCVLMVFTCTHGLHASSTNQTEWLLGAITIQALPHMWHGPNSDRASACLGIQF